MRNDNEYIQITCFYILKIVSYRLECVWGASHVSYSDGAVF